MGFKCQRVERETPHSLARSANEVRGNANPFTGHPVLHFLAHTFIGYLSRFYAIFQWSISEFAAQPEASPRQRTHVQVTACDVTSERGCIPFRLGKLKSLLWSVRRVPRAPRLEGCRLIERSRSTFDLEAQRFGPGHKARSFGSQPSASLIRSLTGKIADSDRFCYLCRGTAGSSH